MSTRPNQAMAQTRGAAIAEVEQRLRISQKARAAALQARREAIEEFWDGVGKLLRSAIHRIGALSQRAWHPRGRHA
ncbi:MAG: hypothetical protein RL341_514 [Pseudomonadota bacterium]